MCGGGGQGSHVNKANRAVHHSETTKVLPLDTTPPCHQLETFVFTVPLAGRQAEE